LRTILTILFYFASSTFIGQIIWDFNDPINVADDSFGNNCPRLVIDNSGNPVVLIGKPNEGLYIVTSEDGVFNTPHLIPTEDNVFMNNTQGPNLTTHNNSIGLSYKIDGQGSTGARYIQSNDNGLTWNEPINIAPNATLDHLMPISAFDSDGNPFIAVKVGEVPNVQEGVLRSIDGGESFLLVEHANSGVGNGIACECCPSSTIFGNGRYYSIYRRNQDNIRDFWLVSSEDGINWDQHLDLDPSDWQLNGCPSSGAKTDWLPDGRLASVFMTGGSGSPQIYLNLSNPVNNDPGSTTMLTVNQFDNSNQNQPHVACGSTHTAVVWEQIDDGFEIKLSIALNDDLPSGLIDIAISPSELLEGSNRHPEVAIIDDKIHLIWQNSTDGTIKYLRGSILNTSSITTPSTFRGLVRIVDALGREVTHTTNQVLFYIYDDGSVEKKFVIE